MCAASRESPVRERALAKPRHKLYGLKHAESTKGVVADWAPVRGLARAASGGSPRPGSGAGERAAQRANPNPNPAAALKLAAMKLAGGGAERPGATTPPLSPIKAAWAQQAALSDVVRAHGWATSLQTLQDSAVWQIGCALQGSGAHRSAAHHGRRQRAVY